MPKGPNGERRPADTNSCAVMVAKIATGEVENTRTAKRGSAGGRARAERMSAAERKEIAERAAGARWSERRRDMSNTQSAILASRFEAKAKDGLADVKFYLSNEAETTVEEVCREINALYDAVERDDYDLFKFNDSYLT